MIAGLGNRTLQLPQQITSGTMAGGQRSHCRNLSTLTSAHVMRRNTTGHQSEDRWPDVSSLKSRN
jgi:hypothetical protein